MRMRAQYFSHARRAESFGLQGLQLAPFASSAVVRYRHRRSSDRVGSSRIVPSDDLDRFISAALHPGTAARSRQQFASGSNLPGSRRHREDPTHPAQPGWLHGDSVSRFQGSKPSPPRAKIPTGTDTSRSVSPAPTEIRAVHIKTTGPASTRRRRPGLPVSPWDQHPARHGRVGAASRRSSPAFFRPSSWRKWW
jgi:hypothetical protein